VEGLILGARRIVVPYLIAGTTWILLSDWLLAGLFPAAFAAGQTLKGLAFVAVTAAVIYIFAERELTEKRQGVEYRLQLERRLAATERFEAMGQLTSGVAHDFNNLLTAISGNIESYLDRSDRPDAPPVELQEARRSAARGAELTRQLLAVGRSQVLSPERVDVNEVIRGMAGLLQSLLGGRVRIETELAADVWTVVVDPGRLEQVVMNLAINARDAMPDGGVLTLRTLNQRIGATEARRFPFPFLPGDYVRLDVRDTGVGIAEEIQAHIFEPFFTTKPKEVGTGLGLATVYGIVKQSGGYITVESTPGAGSAFSVFLPDATNAPAARSLEENAPEVARTGSETILVAEDDAAVRSFAVRALRRGGFEVLEAEKGEDALELLRHRDRPIHLLVTDASMPGMTGKELIEAARAAGFSAPVLLVSGTPERDVYCAVPYLAKPFTAAELGRRVRAILDMPYDGA
jgi:two-component system, cell cycle sensor histidine kinase and response regulator CckA